MPLLSPALPDGPRLTLHPVLWLLLLLLLQVVGEPAYIDIITELLFSGEGHEMYLRSPASFNIPLGEPVHACWIAAACSGDNNDHFWTQHSRPDYTHMLQNHL
jgi:hypothetical protein